MTLQSVSKIGFVVMEAEHIEEDNYSREYLVALIDQFTLSIAGSKYLEVERWNTREEAIRSAYEYAEKCEPFPFWGEWASGDKEVKSIEQKEIEALRNNDD